MRPATLLLLPGLACDAEVWRGLLPALASRLPVQVCDVHTREDSLPAMADRLLAEHPGPLLLAGVSMGGMVAMQAALRAPERLRGLALLGTSARADTPQMIRLRSQAIELFAHGRTEEVLQANVMLALHPAHQRSAALVDAYLAMLRRAGDAQLIRQNRAVMAREDLRPRLPALRCPTLVACGEADLLTPHDHAQEIAAAIPGARLELVPGAGHMLTMEEPARLAALLGRWVQDLGDLMSGA